MTRTKLCCGLAALTASVIVVAISFVAYGIASFVAGNKLAEEGYEAIVLDEHELAIEKLTAALQNRLSEYQRSIVYTNRGVAYNRERRFNEAIRDFTDGLRLNSDLPEAYAGRGWAYQQKREFDKAIVDLNEAIKRNPNSKLAYYSRGLL